MNLIMQVVSGFTKSLPLMALWCVVFAVLERMFPAVERKAVKEWGFNLSVSVLYMTVGAIAAVVGELIGETERASWRSDQPQDRENWWHCPRSRGHVAVHPDLRLFLLLVAPLGA